MVLMNPNPQEFYLDSSGMPLSGVDTFSPAEEQSLKVRKPYTTAKSKESWTEMEREKFLEAIHLFDRDWKKIEAFVGSKTVIQIRSHAQKYFLKIQKSGSKERVPPPRPKRKAAHPYPHKASKIAPATNQPTGQYPSSPRAIFESGYVRCPNTSNMITNQSVDTPTTPWTCESLPAVNLPNTKTALVMPVIASNCCCSSSNESGSGCTVPGPFGQTNQAKCVKVLPDFAQVYSFIGSVFDPNTSNHLQRLKKMDPINVETVLLLMRNLSVNLTNPEFEEHRKLLSLYDVESGKAKCSPLRSALNNAKTVIPAV